MDSSIKKKTSGAPTVQSAHGSSTDQVVSASDFGAKPTGVIAAEETAYLALNNLGQCLSTHDGGMKLLLAKAVALEATKEKIRSDSVKTAINELLDVLYALEGSNRYVITAYNDKKIVFKKEVKCNTNERATKTTVDMETQSPCWWDEMPGKVRQLPT